LICASLAILCGCATESQNPAAVEKPTTKVIEPASQPVKPDSPEKIAEKNARANAHTELNGLLAVYNSGDFHGAIKRFATIEATLKPYKEMELTGLKLTAFSYCLTGRPALCQSTFERALKLDPSFDLEPGEKGHPLWQPVLDRARKKEGS